MQMHTITIDDERLAINSLIRILKAIDPEGIHEGVLRTMELWEYLNSHDVDVIFVDVDLFDLDGITLTKRLMEEKPQMNIVIYTGHPEYKADAMDLFASGYLVKPATEESVKNVLEHLRYPIQDIKVQCFGHFEVFCNQKPVKFERKDSKEVFAYLIDRRGAEVSEDELRFLLWADDEDSDKKKNYIRNIIYDIRGTFADFGIQDVILSSRGHYSANVKKIKCDYYDYLEGKTLPHARLGEYMEQYSNWSEMTKMKIF